MNRFCVGWLLCLGILGFHEGKHVRGQTPDETFEFFENKIRPVLIDACYECHNSHDTAEGGLALDWQEPLMAGGDNGPVIVPGQPDESRLLAVMEHAIPGLEMPEGRPKLSEQVLADFRQWISLGAQDPRKSAPTAEESEKLQAWETLFQRRSAWWSFQPLQQHTPPLFPIETDGPEIDQQVQSPIDAFIRAKLEENNLTLNPIAPPEVIVRRLYLTLLGLPPSNDELTHWVNEFNDAPNEPFSNVIGRLTDSLLASPHFGERWARHWMDWVRYAESHGSEGDPNIPDAWRYRDYLIRSLNADIPIDQLILEYIAGDLLENPRLNADGDTNESAIGPAPWRMVFHGFAPTDALDERVRFIDDHINTMTKAFMGLTVSCARCHDHKFDPISQKDYFALYGITASSRPARQVIDSPSLQSHNLNKLQSLKAQVKEHLASSWLASLDSLPQRLLDRSQDLPQDQTPDSLVGPLSKARQSGDISAAWSALKKEQTLANLPESIYYDDLSQPSTYATWIQSGIGLPHQPQPAGEFTISSEGSDAIEFLFPAGVVSNSISRKHAARLTSPIIPLKQECDLWVYAAGGGDATFRYVVQDYPRNGTVYPFPKLSPQWKWIRLDLGYWTGDEIHIEFAHAQDAPLPQSGNTHSWFAVKHALLLPKGSPAPKMEPSWIPSLSATASDTVPTTLDEAVNLYVRAIESAIQAWIDDTMSDEQASLLSQCLKEKILDSNFAGDPALQSLVHQYRAFESDIPVPRRVPGLDELDAGDRPLFIRGDHKSPDVSVPRSFLSVVDSTPYAAGSSGRRALADSILADSNPLTPRVISNRIWHHLFGRGLVATPDNFGLLGSEPTHPELLDWLALDLKREDWSLKKLVRKIVTSRTWLQSSVPAGESDTVDPMNQWLSHQNLRRLEAESIRDLILTTSRSLERTLFGPPVNGNANRRSVYVAVRRNALDPFLTAFNFPEPFACTGQRNATNVPAQSLMMMNDPNIRNQAQAWVNSLLRTSPDAYSDPSLASLPSEMFAALTGRQPSDTEANQMRLFLTELESAQRQFIDRKADLQNERQRIANTISSILDPVREQLRNELSKDQSTDSEKSTASSRSAVPLPVLAWDFAQSLPDRESVSLHGTAKWTPEGLVTGSQGYASLDLKTDIQTKTLEAWVHLDNLNQSGGGVLAIQTSDGSLFDAIVFAELQPKHWLAGSEFHKRTKALRGYEERDGDSAPVHIAITYDSSGKIQCFRNGEPYGESYTTEPPRIYKSSASTLTFGLRHLPGGGNKYLNGTVVAARIYDRPLTETEVLASFLNGPKVVTEPAVFAMLDKVTQSKVTSLRTELESLDRELESFDSYPLLGDSKSQLVELARALFTLQEAIFLR